MLRRIATVCTATAALTAIAGPALACPPPGDDGKAGDAAAPTSKLTVLYLEDEDATEEEYALECGPRGRAGGNHPQAADACEAVNQAVRGPKNPWEPISKDAICTQIHGGPQTARVTGTWEGREVDAEFDRTNGCEISRWDTLTPALPKVEKAQK